MESNGNHRRPTRSEPESDRTIVFADIETGGIELHRPIVQIAAIAVDQRLDEVDRFEVKIHFDESKASPDALRRIHYRRAEWKENAIPAKKACWAFARFLRKHASVELLRPDLSSFRVAQLACHNAEFDGPFIRRWFERLDVFMPASYRVLCTLQRAYWFFQENPDLGLPDDYRLGTLCRYFGIDFSEYEAHEALADACATALLYRALSEAHGPRGLFERDPTASVMAVDNS